mmetsp:Transcript_51884/g.119335  ORF Transcript_51884/g.119335 Transcript_51884/m.119335 type:complete len:365 (+) Transcript_51884:347-1441(+)
MAKALPSSKRGSPRSSVCRICTSCKRRSSSAAVRVRAPRRRPSPPSGLSCVSRIRPCASRSSRSSLQARRCRRSSSSYLRRWSQRAAPSRGKAARIRRRLPLMARNSQHEQSLRRGKNAPQRAEAQSRAVLQVGARAANQRAAHFSRHWQTHMKATTMSATMARRAARWYFLARWEWTSRRWGRSARTTSPGAATGWDSGSGRHSPNAAVPPPVAKASLTAKGLVLAPARPVAHAEVAAAVRPCEATHARRRLVDAEQLGVRLALLVPRWEGSECWRSQRARARICTRHGLRSATRRRQYSLSRASASLSIRTSFPHGLLDVSITLDMRCHWLTHDSRMVWDYIAIFYDLKLGAAGSSAVAPRA